MSELKNAISLALAALHRAEMISESSLTKCAIAALELALINDQVTAEQSEQTHMGTNQ